MPSSSFVVVCATLAAVVIAAFVVHVVFVIQREDRRRALWSSWARERGFQAGRGAAGALGGRVHTVRGACAGLPFTLGLVRECDGDGSAPVYVRLSVLDPEFVEDVHVLSRNLLGRANAALLGGSIDLADQAFARRFVVASRAHSRALGLLHSAARDALCSFDGGDARLTCGGGELALWWRGDELNVARLDRALRTLEIVLRGRVKTRAA